MNAAISEVLSEIAHENSLHLNTFSSLGGGDINEVYKLECKNADFVVKLNHSERYPGMFEAENTGLRLLKDTNVIDVPQTYTTGEINHLSYLLLEYKSNGEKASTFWRDFGSQLAQLHKCTCDSFGLKIDNYIGSLPQYNESRKNAADFYINMRLEPQFKMASDKGFDLRISETFYQNIRRLIPNEPPSLIHGDLWSGNFLVNSKGSPCLIDPAVAYAPREMDLAMMKLFGGFEEKLFDTYHEIYPLEKGWKERIKLWQLYFLLVHLNIFGTTYRGRVQSIIDHYS